MKKNEEKLMSMRSFTKQLACKLFVCGVFMLCAVGAQAADALSGGLVDPYFDAANGTTWDANTTAIWSTSGTAGTFTQTWTAAGGGAGALATFQGAANTVSLSGAVAAGALDFAVTGYTLGGSGTLTLASPGTVTVGSGSGSISAVIAGGAVTKAGAGTLVLSGLNSYSGSTIITNGTLRLMPVAGAPLLNIQFSRDPSKAYTGQGYLTSPGNNTWNFLQNVNASSSLSYANGQAAAGLSVLVSEAINYDGQGADNSLSGGQVWGDNPSTITVSGLQANTAYKLAVMALRPGMSSACYVTAGGTTLTCGPYSSPDLNAANWAVFNRVTTSAEGVLTFTNANKPGTDPWNHWYLEAFQVTACDTLPSATDVRLASASTFDLNGCSQTIASLSDFGGSGGGSVTNSANGTPAMLTINPSSGSTDFSGVISDGGGIINLVKSGAGTQVLSGANTYTGRTTITAGTLTLGGSGTLGGGSYPGAISLASGATLNHDSSASQALSGTISGAGGLTKTGAGTLVLSGLNSYSGSTIITNGTLRLMPVAGAPLLNLQFSRDASKAYTGQGYLASPGNNTWNFLQNVNSSSSLNYATGTAAAGLSVLVSGIYNYDGQGADASLSGGQAWGQGTGTITVSGLQANTAYKLAVMALRPNMGSVGEITAGGTTLTSGPYSAPDLNPVNWAVFDSVTTSAGGVLTFTIATKPGTDPWANWYLEAFQVSACDTLPSATDVRLASASTFDLNGCSQTIASLSDFGGSGGGSVINSANGTTATLTINPSAGSTAFSGVINDGGGTINLLKSGAGTQVLSGANTYTGRTTITAGTLTLGGSGMLGGGSYPGAISIASGATLNYDSSASQALSGTISGAGGLTKTGAGTLSLAGANSFSGGTTLTAGQLNINSATALGTGVLTLAGGTTLDNTSAGPLTLSSNNAQNWNGDFTFAGTQPLNMGLGAVTISTSRTVTVTSSTLKLGGVISGSGSLTKAGNGTLELHGANSYTGDTVVTGGTLWLNACSLLNVQFSDDAVCAYTGQGYLPSPDNNTWNFLLRTHTSSRLSYANGQAASGLSVFVSDAINYDDLGADNSLSGGQVWGDNPSTITVSGLQANTPYKLAVMALRPGMSSASDVTAGGTTLTSGPYSSPDLNAVNWAAFNSVTTSAGGVLTFTNAHKPGTDPWNHWYLEAFQVEPVTERFNVLPTNTVLQITAPGVVALSGSNTVRRLYLDGVGRTSGTWGSPSSSAAHKNSHFAGTGILVVREITWTGTMILIH